MRQLLKFCSQLHPAGFSGRVQEYAAVIVFIGDRYQSDSIISFPVIGFAYHDGKAGMNK